MGEILGFNLSDWRFWAITIAVILLLYIARPYLHRFLRSVFMGAAQFLNKQSMWLSDTGMRGYQRYSETVAAHMAEDHEKKLRNHQTRITGRVQNYDANIVRIVDKLEASSQNIDANVDSLRSIDLPQTTLQAVQNAMTTETGTPSGKKVVNDVKRAVSTEVQSIRPVLTSIQANLKPVGQSVAALRETSNEFGRLADRVNKDMENFTEIITSKDRIAVAQKQSIIIPWLLALLVMAVALSGVFLNFFLIERPMAEIVGDGVQVGALSLPAAAALVVIFLEAVAGIVLMDAAGLTTLTAISNTTGRVRKTLFWAAIAFLSVFSVFEALLAIQREVIISTEACVEAAAAGLECAESDGGLPITMIAQILLAVLIPWLLAIAAIPLETVIQNFIFILRIVLHQLTMLAAYLLKTVATALKALGIFLLRLYDLIIFFPLAIERMVRAVTSDRKKQT